jgi:hypothetical protein
MNKAQPPVFWRLLVGVIIVALHYGSFFMPVFLFDGHEPVSGLQILMVGWIGLFCGAISWYANPFFLLGLVLFLVGEFRWSHWIALAGLAIALPSFLIREWWFHEGFPTPIRAFGVGFYVWFSSFVLLATGTFTFRHVQLPHKGMTPERTATGEENQTGAEPGAKADGGRDPGSS